MLSSRLHLAKYLIPCLMWQLTMEDAIGNSQTMVYACDDEIAWKYDAGIMDVISMMQELWMSSLCPSCLHGSPCAALFSRGMEITLVYAGPEANMKLSNGRNKKPHPSSTFLKIGICAPPLQYIFCHASLNLVCSLVPFL